MYALSLNMADIIILSQCSWPFEKEYFDFPAVLPSYQVHVASLQKHNCCPSAQHRLFADSQQGAAPLI